MISVDNSGKKRWRSRGQKERETRTKVADRDRLRGRIRKIHGGGGTGDDQDSGTLQQPSRVQHAKRTRRSVTAGTRHARCVMSGITDGRADETMASEKTSLAQTENSRKVQGNGKRKRGTRDLGSSEATGRHGAG